MTSSPLLANPGIVASTTAWGGARRLDEVLDDIAANTSATVVELAIGALPVGDPDATLDRHRGRFTFIGHHTVPLGAGTNLRPGVGDEAAIVDACRRFGLGSYSGHPPNRKVASSAGFYQWAAAYHETLTNAGVGFSVETMYVPQVRGEMVKTGGYHLATPSEVFDFCEWASQRGWERPLLVDASHLHIGWRSGLWTDQQVRELLNSPWVAELHISENDGKTDSHRPLTDSHRVAGWLAGVDTSAIPVVVDEGRRRSRGALSS